MSQAIPLSYRALLLMAGFVSLAVGIGTGLLRLGWNFPLPSSDLAAFHGPLMICGFLGTVIALERAVAVGQRWAYLGPFCAALGGLALVTGADWIIGAGLMTLASVILLSASANIFLRQHALFTFTLLLGSIFWFAGNILWMAGVTISQVTPWWIGFLVMTIAGERLEMTRMLPSSSNSQWTFIGILLLFLFGAAIATFSAAGNIALLSTALLLLALWLLHHDIARKTVKQKGLTRFIAVCLLSGYAWMLIGGLIGLWSPSLQPGSSYDAFLHTILVGFVFSMIFGHAPIIFPAVTKVKVPYHPTFYVPLIVLHASLFARIAGDLFFIPHCRVGGGMLNAIALALFVMGTAAAVVRGRHQVNT